jgi:glycosyltransferase involved in cell wall biosynthesis
MTKVALIANTQWYLYHFRKSLINFLIEQGYEVLAISPPGEYEANLRQMGARWVPWVVGRKTLAPLTEMTVALQLLRIYRLERPILVHHHTIKPVLYGSWAARRADVPGIVNSITGRGYIFLGEDHKAGLLRSIVKPIYRKALNVPGCVVIFENQTDREYFLSEKLITKDQTRLIEGVGVDLNHFIPSPEPDGVPITVLPARLLWDKGVGVLVEAARLLQKRIQARFVLVGGPDPGNPQTVEQTHLEKWVNEGIVEWWGWREDMKTVYQDSHIVTLPSFGEGVPTALLEAAASGRPIVTTDVPGCREVVIDGSNGFLVPPKDAQALAEALYRLIADPDLRVKMGASGRKLIAERFSNRKINMETMTVYNQVLMDTRFSLDVKG